MRAAASFILSGLIACSVPSTLCAQGSPKHDASAARPSVTFGLAQIKLGMTLEEVNAELARSGRHLEFFPNDTRDASVLRNNEPRREGDEGQITFARGHVVYAAFHFAPINTAVELAQELAGAVETLSNKVCLSRNYSSHGTGGSTSQTLFECGAQTIIVMTNEATGYERSTEIVLEIGDAAAS